MDPHMQSSHSWSTHVVHHCTYVCTDCNMGFLFTHTTNQASTLVCGLKQRTQTCSAHLHMQIQKQRSIKMWQSIANVKSLLADWQCQLLQFSYTNHLHYFLVASFLAPLLLSFLYPARLAYSDTEVLITAQSNLSKHTNRLAA